MIKITIYQNQDKEWLGFSSIGHAGLGEEGTDIVCAAVSVLVINTINAIEQYADDTVIVSASQGGRIDYQFEKTPTKEAALLLNTMILGLTSIEANEDYKDYIDIIFEEV